MSLIAFSSYFGIALVVAIPVMITMTYADTNKSSSQRDRLAVWRLGTLITTTFLALYTKFWVASGAGVLMDTTTFQVFCFIGVAEYIAISVLMGRSERVRA